MDSVIPTREDAYRLLTAYNHNDNLIKHALAVEGVMRYFARKRGEDEEKWGIIGLVHDLDYERFPAEHCRKQKRFSDRKTGLKNTSAPSSATDGVFARMWSRGRIWKKSFTPSMSSPALWEPPRLSVLQRVSWIRRQSPCSRNGKTKDLRQASTAQ
jgi:hypothetical protein